MDASSWALVVLASPSWYRSMKGLGMGRRNGGCDLVVGNGVVVGDVCVGLSPICGIRVVRAQWSLWLVVTGVVVVSTCLWLAEGGRRRSQWSSGV